MKNETARREIESLDYYLQNHTDDYSEESHTAMMMAIKALEQEPTVAQERYEDLCEYFGGAKDILNNREDFKAWLGRIKWHIHKAEELYEKYEQEPKTGHWINAKVGKLFPSNDFKCSECGNILDFNGVNCGRGDANYCPNCGAKMVEPQERSEE